MGFTLDDIIIDRVQYGFAEDFNGNPLYVLTQLQDATINISAESTDATDNQGNLVKRFWKAKTGEFTANNAMINLNVIGAASGEGKNVASASNQITMPKIISVKAGEKVVLKDAIYAAEVRNALQAAGADISLVDNAPKFGGEQIFSTVDPNGIRIIFTTDGE